jgi:hypothetical protein
LHGGSLERQPDRPARGDKLTSLHIGHPILLFKEYSSSAVVDIPLFRSVIARETKLTPAGLRAVGRRLANPGRVRTIW